MHAPLDLLGRRVYVFFDVGVVYIGGPGGGGKDQHYYVRAVRRGP